MPGENDSPLQSINSNACGQGILSSTTVGRHVHGHNDIERVITYAFEPPRNDSGVLDVAARLCKQEPLPAAQHRDRMQSWLEVVHDNSVQQIWAYIHPCHT